MEYSPELLVKAKAAKTAEELLTLAAENGISLTAEEAEKYFSKLHNKVTTLSDASLANEELENVAGGSFCSGGRTYSSDSPYFLITTALNSCRGFKRGSHGLIYDSEVCVECEYSFTRGATWYCSARKYFEDPYK